MAEEKEKAPEGKGRAEAGEEAPPGGVQELAHEKAEAEPEPSPDRRSEKRGRLMVAGLIATATVSIVALGVAGIVQLTSRWLTTCPTDLPVNDPAPILWQAVTSDHVKDQPLGVPEKLAGEARFKQQ